MRRLAALIVGLALAMGATGEARSAMAAISLSPTSGSAGSDVSVLGSGFGRKVLVRIFYDGAPVTSVRTNGSGRFSVSFTVPTSASGTGTVLASDGTRSATANFEISGTTTPPPSENPLERPFAAPTTTATVQVPGTIDRTGATDVHAALNDWIASVPDGRIIEFLPGTYKMSQGIQLGNRHHLVFKGAGATFLLTGSSTAHISSGFVIGYSWATKSFGSGGDNIVIDGFTFQGNDPTPGTFGGGENQHAVRVNSAQFIEVLNTTVRAVYGDGVFLDGVDDAWIHDTHVETAGRNGFTLIKGNRVLVEREAYDTVGYATFDLEPNLSTEASADVTFRNSTAGTWQNGIGFVSVDGAGRGADIRRVTIENNTVTGRALQIYVDNKDGVNGNPAGRMQDVVVTDNHGPAGGVLRFNNIDGLTYARNDGTVTVIDCTNVNVGGGGGGANYATEIAADSPLAYFRLGEASGSVMSDQTGNHPGQYVGSPTLGAAGAIGDGNTAVVFGAGQLASVPDWTTIPNKPITIEAWAKQTSTPSDTTIAGWYSASGVLACQLYVLGAGGSPGTTNVRIGTEQGNANADVPMGDGGWHHIVGTIDSSGNARLYFDGALVAGPTAVTFSGGASNNPFQLAAYFDGSMSWPGGIDEVAVYGTALSATRVAAHYAAR